MGSKWQMEKHNDPYYKKAKKEEYRSRASYKLKQLDKKYKLIKEGDTVVDGIEYLERGYEDFVENLNMLGAKITYTS